jgi:YD repeat-containing protein
MKSLLELVIVLCLVGVVFAQDPGNPPNPSDSQAYDKFGVDSINIQNLSIDIDLPVISKEGAIPFSYTLSGNSSCVVVPSGINGSIKNAECGIGLNKYVPFANGFWLTYQNWAFNEARPTGLWVPHYTTRTTGTCAADGGKATTTYTGWYITSPAFETYYLPYTTKTVAETTGTSCVVNISNVVALNGGLAVSISGLGSPFSVTYPNGWIPGGAGSPGRYLVTDTFGNVITEVTSTNVFTDTLGNSTFSVVPFNGVTGAAGTYTWTDTTGTQQSMSEAVSSATIKTAFGCTGVTDNTVSGAEVISSVNYPDGNNVQLAYEQITGGTTGRLQQITLRTGGTISYSYGAPAICNASAIIPSSISRTTSDGTTTYTWAVFTGQNSKFGTTTTILDPGKNKRVYTFMGTNASGLPIGPPSATPTPLTLTQVQVYQNTGTVASPVYTLLSTDVYCYNTNTTNCPTTQAAYPITQKDAYRTLGTMSTSARVSTIYDSYGNVTSISRFGFGDTAYTTKTTIGIGSWNGSSCVAVGSGIVNKACDVFTQDAAGDTISHVRYTYSPKGFPLTVNKWSGSIWIPTTATPNANGTVATSTDVNGQLTTYSYAATGSGGCNSLLLTGTSTTVNGVALTSGRTWDCNGGVVLSATDANGNQSTTTYDSMFRVTSATDPLLFTVNKSYTATSATSSWSFGNGAYSSSTTATVDGLGRSIRTQTTHGSSYDTESTGYVAANPYPYTESEQPCLTSLGQDCAFSSYHYVDALGRKAKDQDGNTGNVSITYNQNDVQTTLSPAPTGEHTKVTQVEYDGLGRVTSTCTIQTSGGSACGQVDGGSGVLTINSYSFGSGSSTVSSSRGSQTRTTVSDALGRPTSNTTPESGTVSSTYDSNGNLSRVTYADSSYLNFAYDVLHRATDITNSSQSATSPCKRFRFDSTTNQYRTPPSGYNGSTADILGRLMEAETDDCAGNQLTDEWFAYNNDGQLTDVWESTPHSGGYYHTTAGYYLNGVLNTLSGIPGYSTFSLSLDTNGRPNAVGLGSLSIVTSVTRNAAGNPTNIGYATPYNNSDTFTYDANSGLMNTFSYSFHSTTESGTLTWNANRTLQQMAIVDGFNSAGTETCTFSYDDVARLLTDNCGSSLWNQSYSYDQFDNITKTGNPGTSWNPGYNSANNRITGASYDGRGNVTYDLNNSYTWNIYNKMASAATGTSHATCGSVYYCFTYDAFGRPVEKSSNTTYTEILYSPIGLTALMSGSTTVTSAVLPLPGGEAVWCTDSGCSGQRSILHRDWLGTTRLATDLNGGQVTVDTGFSPYGETYDTVIDYNNRQQFAGDFQSLLSWLYDTPNREFDVTSGSRWLSPDPAHASWNAYSYPTDPNSQVDSSGLRPCNPGICTTANTAGGFDSGDSLPLGQQYGWASSSDGGVPSFGATNFGLPAGDVGIFQSQQVVTSWGPFYGSIVPGSTWQWTTTGGSAAFSGRFSAPSGPSSGMQIARQVGRLVKTPYKVLAGAFYVETALIGGALLGGGSTAVEAYELETPLQQIAQPIIDSSEAFGCDTCAQNLGQAFQDAGYQPNIIEAQGGAFDTLSYSGETISTSGYHVGVEVDGIVFDNMTNGVPLSTWQSMISSSGSVEFSSTPFHLWIPW